ncbi:hypothetical protein [Ferviditalea candida]|uniref:DUF2802 domain-containing protein n=1 Tax=Ferviditalea candida TaxID=3108399 RepID=A0ABU5ZF49_9BACL|nr:hypothetical protein [Paenibacillaceae bacterium T2]
MEPWMLIVLLGAVIIIYALLRAPKNLMHNRADMTGEIEQTLDAFALQLEEENQQLLRTIGGMKQEYEKLAHKLMDRMNGLEKQVSELAERAASLEKPGCLKEDAIVESRPPIEPISEPISGSGPEEDRISQSAIKGRYKEIIDYYEIGKSIEFIAKKMGMNKGEIQLIIQLAKQEEQFRA